MERKFFMNDFEESLKDHADQFKMMPSKKVWHGIYNDLHPGRRWPSISISLLLIFILVSVGYLNTHNTSQPAAAISKNTIASNNSLVNPQTGVEHDAVANKVSKEKAAQESHAGNRTQNDLSSNKIVLGAEARDNKTKDLQQDQSSTSNLHQPGNADNKSNATDINSANNLNNAAATSTSASSITFNSTNDSKAYLAPKASTNKGEDQKQIQTDPITKPGVEQLTNGQIVFINIPGLELTTKIPSQIGLVQEVKKSADENLYDATKKLSGEENKSDVAIEKKTPDVTKKISKIHKKRNEKVNWVYYAAPVMSSVSFSGQAIKEAPSNNFSIALAANQKENKVLHNPALGLEAGVQMEYSITKKLQFTTGAHLTYSGYKIISNEVHPTFATLILRDPKNGVEFPMSYLSHYGDGTGQTAVSLRNYNWQVSIPIGLQYQLSGNDKVQFSAGANVEPSYVLKSDAYVLSSDGRNYVNDPSLLRKWNMSSNFNAFITFRSHNLKWNIRPNIRYQWFSTYQKTYTIKEHLIDYGIRIGISK